jgi:epoxyqueuosine reductase
MSLLAEFVKQTALDEGFSLAGIAPVAGMRELDYFPAWIEAGCHGEMDYLAKTNGAGDLKRAALANVAPWARSVVVCAANYNSSAPYSTEYANPYATPFANQCAEPSRGWISRYAFVERDYHKLLLAKLRRIESRMVERIIADGHASPRTWCYVDTGPVVERVLAQHSGIGWTGKNGCILNQQLGSWLFLGVILSSHALPPDLPATDRCGSCTRCLDACPTSAFIAPRQLDATRCISYLTIEQRGPVAEELREKMGRHLFGCDICQDVCPWNRRAPISLDPAFAARTELVNPSLEWISGMNIEEFRRSFRGSPVKRAKLEGLLRSAAVAMGNSGDRRHLPRLRELARHEDPAIAEHARWAIARLETTPDADPIQ